MSVASAPVTLTLNVLTTIPDANETAGTTTPSTAVQIQNSSVFVINVTASGLSYTIQSFTAQTIPLNPTGAPITILPTQSLSAASSASATTLTAVWLLPGQTAPMEDGPLTAAAIANALSTQYTATTLVNGVTVNGNGSGNANFTITGLTQGTRYLTLYWTSTSVVDTSAIITGNTTGIIYSTVLPLETFGPIIAAQGGHFDVYIENTLDTAVTVTLPQLAVGQSIKFWAVGAPISPLTHIDDGQIVPVYTYPAGGADTPVSTTITVANTNTAFIPAPSSGQLQRVGTISVFNSTGGGASIVSCQGSPSGINYLTTLVQTAPSYLTAPFDAQISEALMVRASVVNVIVVSYYRTLTAV